MSKIITNNITPRSGSSVGLTGDLTASGNITGVGGTFSGPVSGTTGTFSGNVSVGGTLTYEDVTNIDSVGIITARSDVSIADKIIHTGDTNTAIRFPAADTFTVETGGSERVRVTSGGAVLINSTSASTSDTFLELKNTAAHTELNVISKNDSGAIINLGDTDSYNRGRIKYDNSDNSLTFRTDAVDRLSITSTGAAIFKGGLAEKYENAGTTLGSQPNNPLSDGNVILFTGNESGNKTINFTGVHATLSNGETVSFTAILTPNNSGVINVVQVDGQAITVKWSGGSAPSAGSSGQDIYQFQILKTGTGTSDYTVYGAAANYA